MTQKTLKLNDDWDLFVDTKGDLSVTDKTSKNYAIAQNVANAFRLFTNDAYYFTDEGIPHFLIELRTDGKKD